MSGVHSPRRRRAIFRETGAHGRGGGWRRPPPQHQERGPGQRVVSAESPRGRQGTPTIDHPTRCARNGEVGSARIGEDAATIPVWAPQPAFSPERTAGTPQQDTKAAAPQPTVTVARRWGPLPTMKRHRAAARRADRERGGHRQNSDRGPIRASVSSGRELMTSPGAPPAPRSRS